jgi:Amt family ammonium transporter
MPSPILAIIIGAVGGIIMYIGTNFLNSMKLDDVVGAIPVHMFAGIWGTLIVPLSNPDASYVTQFIGVASVIAFVFIFSYVVLLIIKSIFGLRISEEAEKLGTDKSEVGVVAYSIRD